MPKYYFHIRNGKELEVDDVGTDFASLEVAVSDAKLAAREMISELLMAGEILDGQQFEIMDNRGEVVAKVPFQSVLRLHKVRPHGAGAHRGGLSGRGRLMLSKSRGSRAGFFVNRTGLAESDLPAGRQTAKLRPRPLWLSRDTEPRVSPSCPAIVRGFFRSESYQAEPGR